MYHMPFGDCLSREIGILKVLEAWAWIQLLLFKCGYVRGIYLI
uniref:Uncharacterized protein n=1 Tax=Arundo donax TaxID=35708 RepID=A0A0A9C035_ARUDO